MKSRYLTGYVCVCDPIITQGECHEGVRKVIVGKDSSHDGDESSNILMSQADDPDLPRALVYPMK